MNEPPRYRRIEQLAEQYPDFSAAEIHGALSGMLCSNGSVDCEQWILILFEEQTARFSATERDLLTALYHTTKAELASPDLSFRLLLPDDEEPLADRMQALGDWCHGFLFGFGQTAGEQTWSEDSDEVLRDLVEISRLDAEDSCSEDEEAFTEIAEYVQMAVQVIRGECQNPPRHRLH
jgi:hypothetical protein